MEGSRLDVQVNLCKGSRMSQGLLGCFERRECWVEHLQTLKIYKNILNYPIEQRYTNLDKCIFKAHRLKSRSQRIRLYLPEHKHQYIINIFEMNDPLVELQPFYSSDEQDQILHCQTKKSASSTVQKSHSFKQYIFNFKYNLIHNNIVPIPYFHRSKITLELDSEPAYLLGKCYENANFGKFINHFQSIVWMSYRSVSQTGKSDAGWGCMIRVVQMLMAEVLHRQNPSSNVNDIIDLFKQGKNHLLSLQNVCNQGNIKERWTGSNEILLAVSSILNLYRCANRQNKSLGMKIPSLNLNMEIQIFCEHITITNFQQVKMGKQFPRLVAISSKLIEEGSSHFPQIYSSHAKHLMRMPAFCGMIGGVSNQALYIVGFQDEKVICLDPHYVQDEDEPEKVRYHKKTPRGLPFRELCQSVSFCFYFRDVQEYKNWAAELCHASKLYSPYLIISMDVESPEDMIEKYRKRSQDFQVL